jgi:hypothetical protein
VLALLCLGEQGRAGNRHFQPIYGKDHHDPSGKGPNKVGTWQEEEVDIMADYQKAFGTRPPVNERMAIMNDSDNTGESTVSFIEHLEGFR